jgi:hypothetical protein
MQIYIPEESAHVLLKAAFQHVRANAHTHTCDVAEVGLNKTK